MVDRRRALIGFAVGLASAASGGWLFPTASIAEDSMPTPPQSLGPFYPSTIPAEHDSDLTRVRSIRTSRATDARSPTRPGATPFEPSNR